MSRYPADHAQVLAALFGPARGLSRVVEGALEQQQLDADGCLLPTANPWARRLVDDVEAMVAFDDTWWVVALEGRPLALLGEGEVAEASRCFDVSVVRRAVVAVAMPPPGFEAAPAQADEAAPQADACEFSCDVSGCGLEFGSKRALLARLRTSHHCRCLCYVAAVTDQCPPCRIVFSNRQSDRRHLASSLVKGLCEDTLECALCDDFELGICGHLPPCCRRRCWRHRLG